MLYKQDLRGLGHKRHFLSFFHSIFKLAQGGDIPSPDSVFKLEQRYDFLVTLRKYRKGKNTTQFSN